MSADLYPNASMDHILSIEKLKRSFRLTMSCRWRRKIDRIRKFDHKRLQSETWRCAQILLVRAMPIISTVLNWTTERMDRNQTAIIMVAIIMCNGYNEMTGKMWRARTQSGQTGISEIIFAINSFNFQFELGMFLLYAYLRMAR